MFWRANKRQERTVNGRAGYQRLMEVDRRSRLANQARLRELSLSREHDVRIFCAHDAVEFEMLSRR